MSLTDDFVRKKEWRVCDRSPLDSLNRSSSACPALVSPNWLDTAADAKPSNNWEVTQTRVLLWCLKRPIHTGVPEGRDLGTLIHRTEALNLTKVHLWAEIVRSEVFPSSGKGANGTSLNICSVAQMRRSDEYQCWLFKQHVDDISFNVKEIAPLIDLISLLKLQANNVLFYWSFILTMRRIFLKLNT